VIPFFVVLLVVAYVFVGRVDEVLLLVAGVVEEFCRY